MIAVRAAKAPARMARSHRGSSRGAGRLSFDVVGPDRALWRRSSVGVALWAAASDS
jgi:hypothetical protein